MDRGSSVGRDCGKLKAAKDLARKACEACPKSEDAWIEAARLHGTESDQGKAILASAVESLPNSVAIWMRVTAKRKKMRIAKKSFKESVRKRSEFCPIVESFGRFIRRERRESVAAKTTECCPQHVELWLALARLESYDNARKVLNKARETLPTERAIWVTASRLEEANGNGKMCQKIIDRAIKSLRGKNVKIDRELWMKEAETCEKSEPNRWETCRSVVHAVIGENVDELDQKLTYAADASEFEKNGSFEVARTIRKKLIEVFPEDVEIWIDAADAGEELQKFQRHGPSLARGDDKTSERGNFVAHGGERAMVTRRRDGRANGIRGGVFCKPRKRGHLVGGVQVRI